MARKTSTRKVQIQVDVKAQKAIKSLREMSGQNQRIYKRMEGHLESLNSKYRNFQRDIVALNQAFELMGKAAGAAGNVMRGLLGALTASAAQNSGINQMRHAMTQLGTVDIPGAMEAVEAFAAQQQEVTRYGDDVTRSIVTNIATLLSGTETSVQELTNLAGLTQDVMERTGKGAEEVSAAIAKVYAGQVDALNEILPAQAQYIADVRTVEGEAAAAEAAIEALNQAFGGAASEIDSADQAMARLVNSWGDWVEELGATTAAALDESGFFETVQQSLDRLLVWIGDNGDVIAHRMTAMFNGLQVAAHWAEVLLGTLGEIGRGGGPVDSVMALSELENLMAAVTQARATGRDGEALRRMMTNPRLITPGSAQFDPTLAAAAQEMGRLTDALEAQAAGEGVMPAFADLAEWLGVAVPENRSDTRRREREARAAAAEAEAERRRQMGEAAADAAAAAARERESINLSEMERGLEEARREAEAPVLEAWAQGEMGAARARGGRDRAGVMGALGEMSPAEMALFADSEAMQEFNAQTMAGLDALRVYWLEAWQDMQESPEETSIRMAESVEQGLSVATDAINKFSQLLPRLMAQGAQDGVDQIAAVFQLLQMASDAAIASGLLAKSASAWLGPLSQFFAMSAAVVAFSQSLGKSSGGGRSSAARNAQGVDVGDVMVGQRPEAARMGQPRVINMQIGAILDNTDSRRTVAGWLKEMTDLNEMPAGVMGG